jgi:hypothetical protein
MDTIRNQNTRPVTTPTRVWEWHRYQSGTPHGSSADGAEKISEQEYVRSSPTAGMVITNVRPVPRVCWYNFELGNRAVPDVCLHVVVNTNFGLSGGQSTAVVDLVIHKLQ